MDYFNPGRVYSRPEDPIASLLPPKFRNPYLPPFGSQLIAGSKLPVRRPPTSVPYTDVGQPPPMPPVPQPGPLPPGGSFYPDAAAMMPVPRQPAAVPPPTQLTQAPPVLANTDAMPTADSLPFAEARMGQSRPWMGGAHESASAVRNAWQPNLGPQQGLSSTPVNQVDRVTGGPVQPIGMNWGRYLGPSQSVDLRPLSDPEERRAAIRQAAEMNRQSAETGGQGAALIGNMGPRGARSTYELAAARAEEAGPEVAQRFAQHMAFGRRPYLPPEVRQRLVTARAMGIPPRALNGAMRNPVAGQQNRQQLAEPDWRG